MSGNIAEVEAEVFLSDIYEFSEFKLSDEYFKHTAKLRRSYLMEDVSWWKYLFNRPSDHWLYIDFEHFPHMLMFHKCKVSEISKFMEYFISEFFVRKFREINKVLKKKRYTDQVTIKKVEVEDGFRLIVYIKYYKYYDFWIKREANLNVGTIYIKTKG